MLKPSCLDSTGQFAQTNEAVLKASYHIALRIDEWKKPHTVGEDFIKPCLLLKQ
jgi:hypothetical protein